MHKDYEEAVKAYDSKNYLQTINLLTEVINQTSNNIKSYFLLGNSYFFIKNYNEAIIHFKKYLDLSKADVIEKINIPYTFDILGRCYEALGQESRAIDCYNNAIKINSSCASAWHNLGLLYMKSAQFYLKCNLKEGQSLFLAAQKFLQNALKLAQNNPRFLHSIASWHEAYIKVLERLTNKTEEIINNYKLANEYYNKALAACDVNDVSFRNIIKDNFVQCLAQHGHILYRKERFDDAKVIYLQAFNLDSSHLPTINQIGMCFFKKKNYEDARKYFSMILNVTHDQQELADAWLNIACAFRSEKNSAESENALNNAEKLAPADPYIKEERKKLQELISINSFVNSKNFILDQGPQSNEEYKKEEEISTYTLN